MNTEQIKAAIAEASGFVWRHFARPDIDESTPRYVGEGKSPDERFYISALCRPDRKVIEPLPNYPQDLNAMAEAEGTLDDFAFVEYWQILCTLSRNSADYIKHAPLTDSQLACRASAARRADAFMILKGAHGQTAK